MRRPILKPKYTFDSFVPGEVNRKAYECLLLAATDFKSNPGLIFISGGTATGKTHLLQAFGNKLLQNRQEAKVRYYTAVSFVDEFVSHLEKQTVSNFRDILRQYDAVLIDDVQVWSGKTATQLEILHLFTTICASKKRIIFTANKPPAEIEGLENMMDHFENFTILRLRKPDVAARTEIVKELSLHTCTDMPKDVIRWIASLKGMHVGSIKGLLNRIVAESELRDKKISLAMAQKVFQELYKVKAA